MKSDEFAAAMAAILTGEDSPRNGLLPPPTEMTVLSLADGAAGIDLSYSYDDGDYQEDRLRILITRQPADPDLPDRGVGWRGPVTPEEITARVEHAIEVLTSESGYITVCEACAPEAYRAHLGTAHGE